MRKIDANFYRNLSEKEVEEVAAFERKLREAPKCDEAQRELDAGLVRTVRQIRKDIRKARKG